MVKYCGNCGAKLNDNADFCDECGAPQKEENPSRNNHLIIIGLLAVIIIILAAFLGMGMKASSELAITSGSSIATDDDFKMKLTSDGNGIANEKIHVVFDNGDKYEFDAVTNSKGKASISPDLDVGKYEVTCKFAGNAKYKESSDTMTLKVKEKEPNYEAYDYPRTFASTDTDGDGYVLLGDMNIAHTPKNVQHQMYADSDDNHDGKLNEHEYYKFMYKLNYDKHSYGL